MVYFLPLIPAIDPGPDGSGDALGMLLMINLYLNGIPCILTALALWRTAKWNAIRRPWLALIPVADLWVLGSLSDRYQKQVRGKEKQMRKHLPLLGAAALGSILLVVALTWLLSLLNLNGRMPMTLGMITVLGAVAVWFLFLAYRVMALCDLYTGFARGRSALYIIFSVLCPPLIPFFIFRCHW